MSWICRTCLQTATDSDFIALNDDSIESVAVRNKIADCLPAILIDMVEDPVMCRSCIASLNVSFNFKCQCLQSEARICSYVQSQGNINGLVKLSRTNIVAVEQESGVFDTVAENSMAAIHNECPINDTIVVKQEVEEFVINSQFEGTLQTQSNKPEVSEDHLEDFDDANCQTMYNICANDVNDLQDNINIVKHEPQDFDLDSFNSIAQVHKSYLTDTSQAETCKSEIFESCAEMEADNLGGPIVTDPLSTNARDSGNEVFNTFSCTNCKYSTSTKRKLNLHMKYHTGEKPLKCYDSNHTSVQRSDLRKRIEDNPLKCNVCNYRCNRQSSLEIHMKTHTNEKYFQCEVCHYRCSKQSNFQVHARIHTGEKPFKCPACSYKCAVQSNLVKHMKIHTGEKPLKCQTEQSALREHTKIHTGEKRLKCSLRRKNLMQHMEENHFKCSICSYTCVKQSTLQLHMRLHTGEKPFECRVCNYICNHRGNLQKHMKTLKHMQYTANAQYAFNKAIKQ